MLNALLILIGSYAWAKNLFTTSEIKSAQVTMKNYYKALYLSGDRQHSLVFNQTSLIDDGVELPVQYKSYSNGCINFEIISSLNDRNVQPGERDACFNDKTVLYESMTYYKQ
jgi:hypothetical protein